jgi:hypothetical protein
MSVYCRGETCSAGMLFARLNGLASHSTQCRSVGHFACLVITDTAVGEVRTRVPPSGSVSHIETDPLPESSCRML